jgi:carbamoyl-phosphate synthase large subunit
MSKEINILFLGGAKRVSLAKHFIKAGEKLGHKVVIYSYELDKEVPIAITATIIQGLRWSDPNIYNDLSNIIENNNINIILPFVDPAIELASKLKEIFLDLFIPSTSVEMCKIMFDKKLSSEWFTRNNIPVPTTYNADDISSIKYPAIFKPRTGSASKGIKVIESQEGLNLIQDISSFVVQKYIVNKKEYTVDCYISHLGQIIYIVPRIRLDIAGGESIKSITIRDQRIEDLSTRIINVGKFIGPITIQFVEDLDSHNIYVMEINPRFGGAVVTSIGAGANAPLYIIEEYIGYRLSPISNWRENTLMIRYFEEVIFYADNN